MRGGNRRLKQVFYQAAFASLHSSPHSRVFYDRKLAEGKKHNQALIALARRRVNVLWAMLRDGTEFDPAFATGISMMLSSHRRDSSLCGRAPLLLLVYPKALRRTASPLPMATSKA
jgi:hypothetical protein